MNPSPESPNDRRAVPRNIRDGEHDMLAEAMGANSQATRAGKARLAIWIVALIVAGTGLWLALRSA